MATWSQEAQGRRVGMVLWPRHRRLNQPRFGELPLQSVPGVTQKPYGGGIEDSTSALPSLPRGLNAHILHGHILVSRFGELRERDYHGDQLEGTLVTRHNTPSALQTPGS